MVGIEPSVWWMPPLGCPCGAWWGPYGISHVLTAPLGGVVGVVALTIARMPALRAGGRSGHAATTAANSGSAGITGGVAAP